MRLFDELADRHPLGNPHANEKRSARRPVRGRAMGIMMDPDQRRARPQESPEDLFSKADLDDIQDQIADILGETFKAALDMSVHFQVRIELGYTSFF